MTGWIEDAGLRFEGLNNDDIAALNGILPDLYHLMASYQAIAPRINRVGPVLARLGQKVIEKQEQLTPHP
jgi:hypothetical protein